MKKAAAAAVVLTGAVLMAGIAVNSGCADRRRDRTE